MSARKAKAAAPKYSSAELIERGAVLGYLEVKGSVGGPGREMDRSDLGRVHLREELSDGDFLLVEAGFLKFVDGEYTTDTPQVNAAIKAHWARVHADPGGHEKHADPIS